MKKKWLFGVLAIAMTAATAFGVSACGGAGGNDNGSSSGSLGEISSSMEDSSSEIESESSEDENSSSFEETEYPEDYYTEGLVFTLQDDDTYAVTDYTGTATEVVIPSVYNGKAVTSIGEKAFEYCSNLIEIVIPDSVTSIGNRAFYNCYSLTEIVIPNSVTSIGEWAFFCCDSLTEIVIPDSVTSMGEDAFSGCYHLTIYCVAEIQPSRWCSDWNYSNCPVVWGYTTEE